MPEVSAPGSPSGEYFPVRESLVSKEAEAPGYGLYSYLLLTATQPTGATLQRYEQAVGAYLESIPPARRVEEVRSRETLNVVYLPLRVRPPADVVAYPPGRKDAPAWILEHYDYVRAQLLLASQGKYHRDGPYLVSCLRPLSSGEKQAGGCVRQDLTGTPPEFVRAWVKQFLHDAAVPADWNRTSLGNFVLTLRTNAADYGKRWPEVAASVRTWISAQ